MALFLVIVIYISFIALGIPDSLFGTAWPAIYNDFNLPISYGSFVTGLVSCGTIISSLLSGFLIRKLGTNKVTFFSTFLTAIALICFSFCPNIYLMFLCAIPLGIGAGSIDVALNNYVAQHYGPRHMSFLHCFYGVGVSISPYILSLVINGDNGWRDGYRIAFIIQIVISLILLISLPIWNKVNKEEIIEDEKSSKMPLKDVIKLPGVKVLCTIFFLICAIEFAFSAYGTTYLVEAKGFTKDISAKIALLYFIGITCGRFVSGLLANKVKTYNIIYGGVMFVIIAILFIILPLPNIFTIIAFFLVGFGNGPLFPNFTHLVPKTFGKEISVSVISLQMGFAYVGVMLSPFICGIVGEKLGMNCYPYYLAILLVLNITMILILRKKIKLHYEK